jgi:hypothetical protein
MSKLIDELNGVYLVLERLLKLAEDVGDASRLPTLKALVASGGGNAGASPLVKCKDEIDALKTKLETPISGWKAVGKAWIWPLKEAEVMKTIASLERVQATLQLGLSTDGM